MKRSLLASFLLISFLTLLSCDKNSVDPEMISMQIAGQYKDCVGVGPQKCLQVKENNALNWQLFYSPIQGFTYEEGYEYVLLVRRDRVNNPPADASAFRYTLVELVSKIKL